MHPIHSTTTGIYADLRHQELIAEAEQFRLALQAEAGTLASAGGRSYLSTARRVLGRFGARPRRLPASPA